MTASITPLLSADDLEWCATTMATTEPWVTLRRDLYACRLLLRHAAKERYLITCEGRRAGLLIIDMNGPFAGYLQTICLVEHARGQGLGSEVIAWAESRIFRDSPNVFLCVSSFNHRAQRLYARLGYQHVGTLKGFIVAEHDELLMRKTRADA